MIPFLSRAVFLKLPAGLALLLSVAITAQVFEKGKILDSVLVENSDKESYALYVPNSLSDSKPAPIIFVFDPGARGRVGVQPFISSSEKYGAIVVCSNNSRNNTYEKNFEIANRLFSSVFPDFYVDEEKMFISGFSGGSRLASAIAVLTNKFSGVIGCGAGFSNSLLHQPKPTNQGFVYAGICGDQDMNYIEMLRNKDFLEKFKFTNTLFSFNGNHRWPDAKQIEAAFDWVFLMVSPQHLEKGVQQWFDANYSMANRLKEKDQIILAEQVYERILETKIDNPILDAVQTEHKELITSKSYLSEKKTFEKVLDLETKLFKKLRDKFRSSKKSTKSVNMKSWEKELSKLSSYEGKKHYSKMVYRIKFMLYAAAAESQNLNFNTPTAQQIQFYNALQNIIYPK